MLTLRNNHLISHSRLLYRHSFMIVRHWPFILEQYWSTSASSPLEIHVWWITLTGHNTEALLIASHVNSFQAHNQYIDIHSAAVHKNLFAHMIFWPHYFYIEIFDWKWLLSSAHCKAVIFPSVEIMSLKLPFFRLLKINVFRRLYASFRGGDFWHFQTCIWWYTVLLLLKEWKPLPLLFLLQPHSHYGAYRLQEHTRKAVPCCKDFPTSTAHILYSPQWIEFSILLFQTVKFNHLIWSKWWSITDKNAWHLLLDLRRHSFNTRMIQSHGLILHGTTTGPGTSICGWGDHVLMLRQRVIPLPIMELTLPYLMREPDVLYRTSMMVFGSSILLCWLYVTSENCV